jgi:hypothetical protein
LVEDLVAPINAYAMHAAGGALDTGVIDGPPRFVSGQRTNAQATSYPGTQIRRIEVGIARPFHNGRRIVEKSKKSRDLKENPRSLGY